MTINELNGKFKIVLASASPRRRQILELVGMEFDIWPSDKEEKAGSTDPQEVCTQLSRAKALDVASQIKTYGELHKDITTEGDILVIGADTIVAKGDTILGKPVDDKDAVRMLQFLSDGTHSVYTGVTFVFMSKSGRAGEYSFYEETKVTFYPVGKKEAEYYVATDEVLDKAGAYGIQNKAAAFVKSIEGDYYNVVGLPIARILHELDGFI